MSKTATIHAPPDFHPSELRTFELAVAGERPTQHAHRIETLLAGAPGIRRVEAHLKEARVQVIYDAIQTNPPAIHDHLLAHGYKAARRAD